MVLLLIVSFNNGNQTYKVLPDNYFFKQSLFILSMVRNIAINE